jgi:hypothetical protein
MIDAEKKAQKIIKEGRRYGVTIVQLCEGFLSFAGDHRGSASVEHSMRGKIERYNREGRQ